MTLTSTLSRHALSELDALTAGSPLDEIAVVLKNIAIQLSEVDKLGKALVREESIRKLSKIGIKSAANIVDAAFESLDMTCLSDTGQGSAMSFCDHDLWPDEVSGKDLLSEIARADITDPLFDESHQTVWQNNSPASGRKPCPAATFRG
jgi:hypothetical protein